MSDLLTGRRVTNGVWTGRVLRLERYPGSSGLWATVKWDSMFFARRERPGDLTVIP